MQVLLSSLYKSIIIRQANDIETNPGPFSGDASQNEKSSLPVVLGNFHQGDYQFSTGSRGQQCYPNALIALLYAQVKDVCQWSCEDLDRILIIGDELYKSIRRQVCENYLRVEELPSCIEIFGSVYIIQQDEQILPHLNRSLLIDDSLSLQNALENCFMQNDLALICIGCYASGVIATGSAYYFFDSHARSEDGLPCADGKALLFPCTSVQSLCDYIYKLSSNLGYSETTVIDITGIKIRLQGRKRKQNSDDQQLCKKSI